jgi:hypothetical protein
VQLGNSRLVSRQFSLGFEWLSSGWLGFAVGRQFWLDEAVGGVGRGGPRTSPALNASGRCAGILFAYKIRAQGPGLCRGSRPPAILSATHFIPQGILPVGAEYSIGLCSLWQETGDTQHQEIRFQLEQC